MAATAVGMVAREGADSRLRAMVDQHFDFVWRSVRRLGVWEAEADDAAQKVFLIAASKLSFIEEGREKAFLFSTAMRVASHARRSHNARKEQTGLPIEALADLSPSSDELVEHHRARQLVDSVLARMPDDLRAVLVLHEVEELTTPQIADLVGVPLGTAASRLRRAREMFESIVRAHRRRGAQGGEP